ncbi:MAG TPA: methyl-accepting chemotaxis protein, partial [Leptospiraceae bacterium]|nr:methyl-accepting chemotaxis protein [Leptospiraceae bacterium]
SGVSQVSKLVEDIAAASKEQSEGINQLNTGLNQINQVTMSVASSSEESAAASNTLASQAESFQKIAAKFRLDNSRILNLD